MGSPPPLYPHYFMPSIARIHQLQQSLMYHIFNRAHNRDKIFHDRHDYMYFITLLADYSAHYGMHIYHWTIMPNHYHIAAAFDIPERISSVMAGIGRSYVYYHHKKYMTAGCLWQGRFKSQPIQKEQYLLACGRYIERNAVKASLCDKAWEYEFSSARFYVTGVPDGITRPSPLFSALGDTLEKQQTYYKEFLESFDHKEEIFFEHMEFPCGSKEFVTRLIKENGRYMPRRQGRPRGGCSAGAFNGYSIDTHI